MGWCADDEVVVLLEIILGRFSVNLAGGGDNNSLMIFCGEIEYSGRAIDIGFDSLNGVMHHQFNADSSGEVKNG